MKSLIVMLMTLSFSSFAAGKEKAPEIADELNDEIIALPDNMEEARQGIGDQINELLSALKASKPETEEKSFPLVKIENLEQADEYCEEYFEGMFFWWSCEEDLAGKEFNADVFEVAKSVSMRNQLLAKQILLTAAGKYINSDAFLFYTSMVTVANLPKLVAIMADKQFNKNWIGYCNSRDNISNLINPIMSARRLNQGNILSCINVIAGQEPGGFIRRGRVFLCKRKIGVVPRTQCLREVFLN